MDKEKLEEIKKCLKEFKTNKFIKQDKPLGFINTESYECVLNNGEVIKREKILKNSRDGGAAIVLALTTDNHFILAIEPRVFTEETVDIGLPAGYIDEDEVPLDAAKRELLEETGYQSNNWRFLGKYYQDQGCSAACNYYYLATNCIKVTEQSLDESEFIKYFLVDYDELNWLIDNDYIKGLNSAYTILKAKTLIRR